MTLLRYQPWSLVGRLHRELDQAIGDNAPVTLIPRTEVQEHSDRYELRVDLPGVLPQQTEVTAEDGVLTIKATRKPAQAEANAQDERPLWTYERRFTLPEDANSEAIEARSNHGVLTVSVGRQAKVQPRRIQVAAA